MRKTVVCLACVLVACALQLACTSSPVGSNGKIALRSLDGASVDDTMMVSGTLPRMPYQREALYQIQSHTGPGENKAIYVTDVIHPEYKIIPLETSENCVIGNIVDIFRDDSLLFLVDMWSDRICAFDLNGKFLNQIGRKGHAKNEYVHMMRVAFDKRNKRVCIYDGASQKLVFYDYKGKFLSRESLYFEYEHMAFADDGRRVFLTLPYDHKDYDAMNTCRLTVTDGRGMPLCGVLPDIGFPRYRFDGCQFSCGVDKPLHSNPNGVFYLDILSPDTIWRVGKDECVPFLVADFGESFTTPESYREMTNEAYLKRMNQVKYLHDDFLFTRDFGYLNMNFGDRAVLNLKTGKYLTGELWRKPGATFHNFSEYAYESYPNDQIFLYDWENNQIVKVWDAPELTRRLKMFVKDDDWKEVYQSWPQSDRDILERISPEDNPVLVVATLKEF